MTQIDVVINKKISIPIHKQIQLQLRGQIVSGELTEGTHLPSVRQMSDLIGFNRHTITKAYAELERDGLVETFASTGTFVKNRNGNVNQKDYKKLTEMMQNLYQEAGKLGFETEDIMTAVFCNAVQAENKLLKGLFIECNRFAVDQYRDDIQNAINIDVDGIMLDDLVMDAETKRRLENYDIIMTTIGHYAKVKSKLVDFSNVYALNFGPYLAVVNQIQQLEKDVSIGLFCVNTYGATTLCETLKDLGITSRPMFIGDLQDEQSAKQLINKVDILVVSKNALAQNKGLFANAGKHIIEYKNVLQKSSIALLKQVIATMPPSRMRKI